MSHPVVFRPMQARFLTVPEAPFVYWVTVSIVDLLASSHTLDQRAEVRQGMATTDNARFLRFSFEVPAESAYWVPYVKGGRYQKWAGLELLNVNWREDGKVLKNAVLKIPSNKHWSRRIASEDKYFAPGLTYTILGRGSVGIRFHERSIFDVHGTSIFPYEIEDRWYLAGVLNARLASYLLRIISQSLVLHAGYIARLPLPASEAMRREIPSCARNAFALKSWLVSRDLIERSFVYCPPSGTTLTEAWWIATDETEGVAALLHSLEGLSEHEVFAAYCIAEGDLAAVLDETGTPAGWHPLLEGYDALPPMPEGLAVPLEVIEPLGRELRHSLSDTELTELKSRLRGMYEAGWGKRLAAEEPDNSESDADEGDGEAVALGARIPVPSETFLEDLAQALKVHPISVYWLLKELREREGVVSLPELRRYIQDYFTGMILRLLGHRWPKQIEAGEPVPEWADPDGIIPLTDGTGERTLLDRVRERIAADFGEARVDAIEQEFRQLMERSLSDWLARDFFTHHISQFKRRPIA